MGRGNIEGLVKDNKGKAVPGATVSLLRFYGKDLTLKATNVTGADGSFSFPDIWYGPYDIRAVYADQSVELPLVLNEGRIPVLLTLLRDVPSVTPGPSITPCPPTRQPLRARARRSRSHPGRPRLRPRLSRFPT